MKVRASQIRVCAFSLAVIAICLFPARDADAHVGTGIDLDRQGRIYFIDTYHNCVWRLDNDGTLTPLLRGVHFDYLVAGDGFVYVIKENGIWMISSQGQMTEVLSSTQFPEGSRPLCIDRQANIYFINPNIALERVPEIYRRTARGKVTIIAGGQESEHNVATAEALFRHINSAVCPPDESLYVRDDQYIRRISPDGKVSTLVNSEDAAMAEGGEDSLVRTMGMAADALGNVYVANYWKRAVVKVTPDGGLSTILTSNWPWVPVGVAITDGDIYVLERIGNPYGPSGLFDVSTLTDRLGSPRVRKVSLDAITTLAVVKGDQGLAIFVVPLILASAGFLFWLARRKRAKRAICV